MENFIRKLSIDYIDACPKLKQDNRPLACFAAAGNPLFAKLKEVVSPTHALPTDLLPDAKSEWSASIIC
jgi:hypothetical protein